MIKPNNYDNVQAYAGFTPLTPGGHICKILNVEETKSKAGRDMIVISIDTDKTDSQPDYFMQQYKSNTKEGKKWSNNAVVRQLVLDAEGNTNRGFKTFIEAVENSNTGFKVQWGDNFSNCLKNKLIGGVFGREEYLNSYGESKFAVKIQGFKAVEDVKSGTVEAPKDKLLNPTTDNNTFGGEDITPVDDGDMPF
jgi:hypothetical protein